MFQKEEPRPCLLAFPPTSSSPSFFFLHFYLMFSLLFYSFFVPPHNITAAPPLPPFLTTSTENPHHGQNSLLPLLPLSFAFTSRHHFHNYHSLSPPSASTTNYRDSICHIYPPIPSTFTTTRYNHPSHPSPAASIYPSHMLSPTITNSRSNINFGACHRSFPRSL